MKKFYKKRILLLVNYSSGVGNGKRDLAEMIDEFVKLHCEVTVYPILPKIGLDSETIIQNRIHDYDVVVCYGGDGTLNYVVNALMNHHINKPIGYIPGGSTNDFSKSFDSTKTIAQKCKAIVEGKTFAYDIGCFNDKKYFNYVAAFGAFTKTSYSASVDAKNVLGYGAYALEALASLPESFSYRVEMEIEHDGIKEKGTYIYGSISNSLSVGGMKLPFFPKVALDDGEFEILLVKSPDNLIDVANILSDLASGKVDDNYVFAFKAKEITMHASEKVAWTLDGEFGGEYKNSHIICQPKAIKIMINK